MLESSESDGFEKSAESYLVGQDYLMRSESKFWKNSVLNQEVKTIGVENGLHNQTGQEIFEDYRGIEVLSSYQRIDILGLKWVLLSEIDYREVIQPIRNLRAYILIISSIVMIFVFLLSVWIAGRFSKPIINLTNASKSIEAGEETKVYHNSNDEIRDLTESFNKMTATLIQKNHELEVEKHKRYELVLDAQEQERGRLSRELHDGIGQTFIALQLQLEFAKNSENDEKNKQIDNVISNMEASIDEIRRLSNNLMPAVLYEFGLTTAVKELINNISKYSSIAISHKIDCNIPRMDEKKTIYLYRITQEIFTNAIKYSDAENIIIKLFQNKNEIHLEIVDDGIGFDINQAEEKFGNGLYNIKERVELLNGQVRLDSQIGKGAKYSIIIPNDNE
jgi:signal transduction histidine kinase